MIGPHDRIALPACVELVPGGLRDRVRGQTLELNGAAVVALREAGTVGAAAEALASEYALDEGRALVDATRFCAELNDRLLLNVFVPGGFATLAVRWLARLPFLLPLRALPRLPARRHAVATGTRLETLLSGSRAVAPPALATGLATALVTAVALAALGAASVSVALAVGTAAALGIVVHELGHLLLLRGVPACAVVRGLRVAVLHQPQAPGRDALVAAGGPGAGLLCALALLAVLALRPGPELAAASLVLCAQATGLTAITRDGRKLCAVS